MSDAAPLRNAFDADAVADLIDQLPNGLAVLAADGTWTRANAALGALWGVPPAALAGHAAHRERLPGLAAAIDAALARLPAADDSLRDIAVPDDARGRHLRLSLRPLTGTAALLQLHDDSARARLEAQQDTLAFGISHELRAPVRAIEQFARRLLAHDGAADAQTTRDHLQRILRASGAAGALIDALLDTLRASRPPRAPAAVDISLLGDWICADLQDAAPGRAAQIRIAPDLWAWGDEYALRQLLGKLLHNAWTFSAHRDTVRIELDGERIGERLHLRLRDAGRGFDMRYADRLFVPFGRLHSADDGAGHGLGLSIARQLVHAQGGHIRVESEPDVGTTFFIELPAVPDEDAAAS